MCENIAGLHVALVSILETSTTPYDILKAMVNLSLFTCICVNFKITAGSANSSNFVTSGGCIQQLLFSPRPAVNARSASEFLLDQSVVGHEMQFPPCDRTLQANAETRPYPLTNCLTEALTVSVVCRRHTTISKLASTTAKPCSSTHKCSFSILTVVVRGVASLFCFTKRSEGSSRGEKELGTAETKNLTHCPSRENRMLSLNDHLPTLGFENPGILTS